MIPRRRAVPHGLLDASLPVEDPRAATVEEVAHDVPRPEEREHLSVLDGRIVDVHDDRHARRLRRSKAPPERLETVLGDDLLLDPHLHANHDVSVIPRHRGRQVRVRVVEVAVLPDPEVAEPDRRDVEEPEHARFRPGHHVLAQPREIRGARAPRVTERRHAGRGAHGIGLDSQVVARDEGVGVEVDQPRRHVGARHVHDLPGAGRRNRGVDRRHTSRREGDVPPSVHPGGGIDHVAAGQQEVMAHPGPPPFALEAAERIAEHEHGGAEPEPDVEARSAVGRLAKRVGRSRPLPRSPRH